MMVVVIVADVVKGEEVQRLLRVYNSRMIRVPSIRASALVTRIQKVHLHTLNL